MSELHDSLQENRAWFNNGARIRFLKNGKVLYRNATFNERLRVYMECERLKILINLQETFKIKVYDKRTNRNANKKD